ncbi:MULTISPECIES: hypothetical protein [unclassified Haladaptatus]|uniref:hypothetical protein n=1 Tax=unclassified Haladaptatus TaxID=2622732 RepID=UPI00209BDD6C|nr:MULTISPECIES: hypothetical protein [unclassified Haladaptatus]MCO8245973.1 hypothetical protein [Haladaptatus sp. AB643]MCO8254407.1 hypothetical protein [Haladaptatus sp. AB618]
MTRNSPKAAAGMMTMDERLSSPPRTGLDHGSTDVVFSAASVGSEFSVVCPDSLG